MKSVFTICSNNYLAQAKTLGDSLLKNNPNYSFFIILCDKKNEKIDYSFFEPHEIIEVEKIAITSFDKMADQYSVVELNTSIKPFVFGYLFEKYPEIETVLYLDPDIVVFGSLEILEADFNDSSVLLTPHIYTPINFDGKNPTESLFTNYGMYNLGFLGLKRGADSSELISWWKERLAVNCFEKIEEGIFVDQLPMNFAPLFFDNVKILKNMGLNMAPWNLHERKLSFKDNTFFVNEKKPLVFFHFSSYKPDSPDVIASFYDRYSFNDNKALKDLYDNYRNELLKNKFLLYKEITCFYGKNGFHRPSKISLLADELLVLKKEIQKINKKFTLVNEKLKLSKEELNLANEKISLIYATKEWRAGLFLQKIVKTLFLRKVIILIAKFSRRIFRFFRKLITFLIMPWKLIYFKYFKKRKKRKINRNSKKIVYIGHSYHNKTKSTAFLIDYLREFYEVDVILDESWRGEGQTYPDLSFIDESYLGVIFFQNLPSHDVLEKIQNENMIFFPMYDGVRHDFSFWAPYGKLKIMNFSTTLHKRLISWGFDSIIVQYFPEPQKFIPGNKEEVFFWNRISKININVLAKVFEGNDVKIHIHKAIDPGHHLVQPSQLQEKQLGITYSDWFETREEMWNVIKQKGIYIAPRELEGIGMSFLEAMSMGKIVIAVDNPTMNEYIKHGKNGYLFNLKNPKRIDLSDIEKVQKNTYAFMQDGFKKWEKNKHSIIQFIEKQ